MHRIFSAAGRLSLLASALLAPLAQATPVGCDGAPTPDGKMFPEPLLSVSYLSFAEFQCGVEELAERFPDRLEVTSLGESEAGYPVYDILMTDETAMGPKRQLFVMSSIHGNEFGAREGAARMIEEMADPALRGADDMIETLLDNFVIHWVFSNPDGWTNGEPLTNEGQGFQYTRANATGTDLNRNFPVQGYFAYLQPDYFRKEGRAVADLMRQHAGNWYLGTDNHGQLADGYLAAGLQIVGEFDYQKSETLARFADGISAAMGEYLSTTLFYEVEQQVGEYAGAYHWGTLYDILGYSASGSGIDFFNTPGVVEGTGFATELSYANQQGANQNSYFAPLNQIWTDSVRAINYTMFAQAIDPVKFTFELGGDVAYLFDPKRIRHDDENGNGHPADPGGYGQQPYDVSRMKFFEDLAVHADRRVDPVRVGELLSGAVSLDAYDSLVLANNAMPEPAGDRAAWMARLRAWVEQGGNLVLTDAALRALPELVDGIGASDVRMTKSYVGSVETFVDRSHPLNAGLRGVASQTFDTVPIGMSFGGANNVAPNWEVLTTAWAAAGGYTAGTHSSTHTVHGELSLGKGRIGILGAILPDPTEEHYHPFGLQNYAVTYTGYTLLQNHLDWRNPGKLKAQPLRGAPAANAAGGGAGGAVLLLLLGLGLIARVRSRTLI